MECVSSETVLVFSDKNVSSNVFHILANAVVWNDCNRKQILNYKNNELVFKQGITADGLFLVLEGKLKISKFGHNNREQIVRLSNVGDITGHVAFFANELHSCTASSIGQSKILFLPRASVLSVLEKNVNLLYAINEFLAKEIRRAEEKIVTIAQKQVKQRVIEAILMLQKKYGFESDGATLAITLSRTEIAGIAGTVRETVSRMLADLSELGLIEIDNKKIKFLDQKELIRLAQ